MTIIRMIRPPEQGSGDGLFSAEAGGVVSGCLMVKLHNKSRNKYA
jgi:hypothetical protein